MPATGKEGILSSHPQIATLRLRLTVIWGRVGTLWVPGKCPFALLGLEILSPCSPLSPGLTVGIDRFKLQVPQTSKQPSKVLKMLTSGGGAQDPGVHCETWASPRVGLPRSRAAQDPQCWPCSGGPKATSLPIPSPDLCALPPAMLLWHLSSN